MMTDTPENVTLVPIARIEVLNSRDRNMKVFEEIVESIQLIGLKKPITVAERAGEDGQLKYMLVCGEGRLNAFRILGETHIPALVVDVSDEDAFIMSLAENIARRGYRPLEILADIELLRERGYTADVIIQKTGLSPKYVRDIVFLLEQGEERLIEGVQRGSIPLTTALEIARASANDPNNANGEGQGEGGGSNLGDLLQEAYENGCPQVLFLDSQEGKYIEELGGMNVFLVLKDGTLVTPELTGSILEGVTRMSIIELARDRGHQVQERKITIDEWRNGIASGEVTEAFACGTAAVVTPIAALKGRGFIAGDENAPAGKLTMSLRQELTDIQSGRLPDRHGWMVRLV
jgi:ParB/RepB/Spo0J family partition protein